MMVLMLEHVVMRTEVIQDSLLCLFMGTLILGETHESLHYEKKASME